MVMLLAENGIRRHRCLCRVSAGSTSLRTFSPLSFRVLIRTFVGGFRIGTVCSRVVRSVESENGFSGKLIRLIKAMINSVHNYVRISPGTETKRRTPIPTLQHHLPDSMRRFGLNNRSTIFTKSGLFVCFSGDILCAPYPSSFGRLLGLS